MLKIKNIVFDLGGVLIDWNPEYLFRDVFKTVEEMRYFLNEVCPLSWNIEQDAGRLVDEGTIVKQKEFPEYKDEIALYYGQWEKMLGGTIYANLNLFYKLKKNYRVFSLTNWYKETFPIAQNRYEFLNEFDGIVVSGYEKMVKPDKKFYQLLLSRYSLKAVESLFIDDNIGNIEAAISLGFETIHIKEGTNLALELLGKSILVD